MKQGPASILIEKREAEPVVGGSFTHREWSYLYTTFYFYVSASV